MNRLKQAGLIVGAICVGCVLLIGSAWMAERSAAQSYGPSVGNAPSRPRENRPPGNNPFSNSDEEPKPDPLPEGTKLWQDFDGIEKSARINDRPGNYEALKTLGDFFDGLYQIQPEFRQVAYPFYYWCDFFPGHTWTRVDSEEHLKKITTEWEAEARQSGTILRNKYRAFNVLVEECVFIEFADKSGTRGREFDQTLGNKNRKTFALVRDRHPGRGLLVRAKIQLEPLDPANSEDAGVAEKWLFLVQVKDGWKVAWFED